ncbi:MAG: T9SS type A sorting domain-containing protein [Bacteroidetes bacterium]|nr:T9SS type A sorting domain-containing protein [Bacteroidota bacterium]
MSLIVALVSMINYAHAALIGVSANITTNTTWTSNNTYLLQGKIFVKGGAVLTIQPGTIIVGENATQGSLIITRGSQIIANGTAASPIVFTSEQAPGARSYGDWGGLIILGAAPVNQAGGVGIIEGGFTAPDGEYGGNNPADNSGILRYVRIEFAGIAFQPNSEINGLTCGGVGSGTTIDYVMVSFCGDDSYEFFGGTVNAKHLIAYRGLDDDFDTDNGYSGKIQFAISLRDPNAADVSGSHSFESDNDATGSTNSPVTKAIFSNVTSCGPFATTSTVVNANYKAGARLRRSTQEKIYNSLFMGWNYGLWVDGTNCENNANAGDLQWQNILTSGIPNVPIHTQNPLSPFNTTTWVATGGFNNADYANNTDLQLTNPFNLPSPNFVPQAASPALTAGSFVNSNLSDPFFEVVNYAGAIGSTDWTKCWTNYDCVNTDYEGLYTNPGIAINNAPTVTIAFTGTASFCNSKLLTSTTSSVTGYQWRKTNVDINSANNATYSATSSGTYSLVVTNAAGCTKQSNNRVLTLKPNPATPIIAAHCNTGVNYLGTTAAYSAYLWKRSGFNVAGGTTRNIAPTLAGSYTVVGTGSNGCTSSSAARTYPTTAVGVTKLKATKCNNNYSATTGAMACDAVVGATSVQYYFENTLTPGVVYASRKGSISSFALSNVVPALVVGQSYNVYARTIIGNDTACAGASCPINITSAREGVFGNDNDLEMSFYPNPVVDVVNFNFTTSENSNVLIQVTDITGKIVSTVFNNALDAGTHSIDGNMQAVAAGQYFVQVKLNGELKYSSMISKN